MIKVFAVLIAKNLSYYPVKFLKNIKNKIMLCLPEVGIIENINSIILNNIMCYPGELPTHSKADGLGFGGHRLT